MIQEVFRHEDTDGTIRHFCIPVLWADIHRSTDRWTMTEIPIGRADADFIMKARGLDPKRMRAYPLAKLDTPGIGCIFPDGSVLIVDGNHRLVKRVRRGLTTMKLWMAPQAVWKDGLVDGRDLLSLT